ncbi:hypothetical protein FDB61_15870 [Clostridium botulinum]|nr:hypothetical protein [Clostridium botulinum]
MANILKFKLKKEADCDKNLQPIGEMKINLYACCDSIQSWVAYINDIKEIENIIKPENIDNLFNESLSEYESEIFYGVLKNNKNYEFYDKKYMY